MSNVTELAPHQSQTCLSLRCPLLRVIDDNLFVCHLAERVQQFQQNGQSRNIAERNAAIEAENQHTMLPQGCALGFSTD